jgi:hypothetical protein
MDSERRQSPRYPFIASAEVMESDSGARLEARTCDLSSAGCYLDMINPLPLGTKVRIQITHQGHAMLVGAVVAHVEPNMGMGVTFTDMEPTVVAALETWLRPAPEG